MSEIDPWALPAAGQAPGQAGIPGTPYRPVVLARPLNRPLPIVVLALGVLYVLVSLAEIFALNHRAGLASQLVNGDEITVAQADSADHLVTGVSVAAIVVFVGALVAIGLWQRSLNATLGSVGARRAVFARAGYVYFRATWVVSLVLSIFLNSTQNNDQDFTPEQVVSHDHQTMLYYGLRAVIGVILIVFAVRLKRISEEAVARLGGSIAGSALPYQG